MSDFLFIKCWIFCLNTLLCLNQSFGKLKKKKLEIKIKKISLNFILFYKNILILNILKNLDVLLFEKTRKYIVILR